MNPNPLHPSAKPRSMTEIDLDLCRAAMRRRRHTDEVSRQGNLLVIDGLLDERLAAARK